MLLAIFGYIYNWKYIITSIKKWRHFFWATWYPIFASKKEKELSDLIKGDQLLLLKYFSKEINNTKRIEESIVLRILISEDHCNLETLNKELNNRFGYSIDNDTYKSVVSNLKLLFTTERFNKKDLPVGEIKGYHIIAEEFNSISCGKTLKEALSNKTFKNYLIDSIEYSLNIFSNQFKKENFNKGFILYKKYSRKDKSYEE